MTIDTRSTLTRSRRGWLALALAFSAGQAFAQANDDCHTAQPLALGQRVTGNTDAAFPDLDFPPDCVFDNQFLGVWYSVVGDGTTLTASTCGPATDFNTLLVVFCGECNGLFCVGSNDDGECDFNAEFSWCTEVGTTYFIMVAGTNLDTGNFEFTVTSDGIPCDDPPLCAPCLFECPPGAIPEGEEMCFDDYKDITNGGCNAELVRYSSITMNGAPVCGTTGSFIQFDPDLGPLPKRDEDWYRFTINQPRKITARIEGRTGVVAALADLSLGCPTGEFLAGARADACRVGEFEAWLHPGTYALVVFPQEFDFVCGDPYALELDGVAFTPPANDTCAQAISVAVGSSVQGSTSGAKIDDHVPVCGEIHTAPGAWYKVVGDGRRLTAGTCAFADYDSEVTVYCGDCSGLACVGANGDDDACAPGASVTWCSEAGTTYYILVNGFASEHGTFELSVTADGACDDPPSCAPCLVPPVGDPEGEPPCEDFGVDHFNAGCETSPPLFSTIACGQTISGESGTFWKIERELGRVRGADSDWYRFVLDEPSAVTAHIEAEFPARIGFSDLNGECQFGLFPSVDVDACEPGSVRTLLQPGVYAVAVMPTVQQQVPCGARYNISLDCEPAVFAPNDSCENAELLTVPGQATGSTLNATLEFVDSCFFSGVVSPGVWYKVVGSGTTYRASLCPGADFDARLSVLCGTCDAGLCIAFGDDECGFAPEATWCTEPGRTYYLLVHGSDAQGDFTIQVEDLGTTCFPGFCPSECSADFTSSSDPNDPFYGVPDGVADASDFFYFLDQFASGSFVADLTGSSDPNDPSYGAPDGVIDAADFFYFLDVFVACE